MRYIRWSMILVSIIFCIATVGAAELLVSETQVDYGSVKEGPSIVKKIVLTNSGPDILTITNVATS